MSAFSFYQNQGDIDLLVDSLAQQLAKTADKKEDSFSESEVDSEVVRSILAHLPSADDTVKKTASEQYGNAYVWTGEHGNKIRVQEDVGNNDYMLVINHKLAGVYRSAQNKWDITKGRYNDVLAYTVATLNKCATSLEERGHPLIADIDDVLSFVATEMAD